VHDRINYCQRRQVVHDEYAPGLETLDQWFLTIPTLLTAIPKDIDLEPLARGYGRRKGGHEELYPRTLKFDFFLLKISTKKVDFLISSMGNEISPHLSPWKIFLTTSGKIHCWSLLEKILPTPMLAVMLLVKVVVFVVFGFEG